MEELWQDILLKQLVPDGCWDPFAFVDAVERTEEDIETLQNIQRLEFESFVESFLG